MNYAASGCAQRTTSKRWSTARILASISLFGLLLSFGCAGAHSPYRKRPPQPDHKHLVDHTITLSWNQSTVNNGFCSSTVLVSCYTGFNEGYVLGTTQVQLHTDTTAVCSGTTQPLACTSTFNGIIPIGSDTFYIVTTFLDQNGVAGVTTTALSPAVQVGGDPATSVKAVVQ